MFWYSNCLGVALKCLSDEVSGSSLPAFRKLTDTTAERSRHRRVVYHSTAILTAKHPFERKLGQSKGQRWSYTGKKPLVCKVKLPSSKPKLSSIPEGGGWWTCFGGPSARRPKATVCFTISRCESYFFLALSLSALVISRNWIDFFNILSPQPWGTLSNCQSKIC